MLQEKTVALKIYELGLKKFGHITEYILSYIDFMSHLNGKFIFSSVIFCLIVFEISSSAICIFPSSSVGVNSNTKEFALLYIM